MLHYLTKLDYKFFFLNVHRKISHEILWTNTTDKGEIVERKNVSRRTRRRVRNGESWGEVGRKKRQRDSGLNLQTKLFIYQTINEWRYGGSVNRAINTSLHTAEEAEKANSQMVSVCCHLFIWLLFSFSCAFFWGMCQSQGGQTARGLDCMILRKVMKKSYKLCWKNLKGNTGNLS